MSEANYCRKHPKVATNLRCNKCERFICPSCLVHTPVGGRCEQCANVRPLPTFDVGGAVLARGIAASLAIGTAGGVVFWLLSDPVLHRVPYLSMAAMIGLGYLIGEGTSAAANRRRGRTLQYVAAAGFLTAYGIIIAGSGFFLSSIWGALIALYLATSKVR